VLLKRDADAEQQLPGTCLGGVAAQFGELDFQLGHLHAVVFAHVRQGVNTIALGFPRATAQHGP